MLDGWRGDLDAASALLDEVRRLEQTDWPAWLPVLRLYITIRVAHMGGEFAGAISELPVMLARLQREGEGSLKILSL